MSCPPKVVWAPTPMPWALTLTSNKLASFIVIRQGSWVHGPGPWPWPSDVVKECWNVNTAIMCNCRWCMISCRQKLVRRLTVCWQSCRTRSSSSSLNLRPPLNTFKAWPCLMKFTNEWVQTHRLVSQLVRWFGGVVVRASDLWSRDREFDSRSVHCLIA